MLSVDNYQSFSPKYINYQSHGQSMTGKNQCAIHTDNAVPTLAVTDTTQYTLRVCDQNGISLQWYIVEIYHSGWKPSIQTTCLTGSAALHISSQADNTVQDCHACRLYCTYMLRAIQYWTAHFQSYNAELHISSHTNKTVSDYQAYRHFFTYTLLVIQGCTAHCQSCNHVLYMFNYTMLLSAVPVRSHCV